MQLTVESFFTVQSVPGAQTISTYYSGAVYTLGIAEFEHPRNLSAAVENIAAYTVDDLSRFTMEEVADIGIRKKV